MKKTVFVIVAFAMALSACQMQPIVNAEVSKFLTTSCSNFLHHRCITVTVTNGQIDDIAPAKFQQANHLIIWSIGTTGYKFVPDIGIKFKNSPTPPIDEFSCKEAFNGTVFVCFNRHTVSPVTYTYGVNLIDDAQHALSKDPFIVND